MADKLVRENWQVRAEANLDWLRVSRVSGDYLSIYEEVNGRTPPHNLSRDATRRDLRQAPVCEVLPDGRVFGDAYFNRPRRV